MLGRKDFSRDEINHARSDIDQQVAAYRGLVSATSASDPKVAAALEEFEPRFVNGLILALDRYFVHRIRPVAGKDGNPLNEVELLVEALVDHDGVFSGNKVIKYVPGSSVLKLEVGAPIRLRVEQFEQLAEAFFATLEAKFLAT